MLIHTTRFGEIDVDPGRVLHFPRGIPGFEHVKKYLLIEYKDGKYNWLQAMDDPDLAFMVCDPSLFAISYNVPEPVLTFLGVTGEKDLAILLIIRVDRAEKKVIPHVQGPLVFNTRNRKGMQWVLDRKDLESFVQTREEIRNTG